MDKELEIFKKFYDAGDVELIEILLDSKWCEKEYEIHYEVYGDIYSGELGYSSVIDDHIIYYLDSGQGFKCQLILSLKNKVDDLEDDEDGDEDE